MERVNENKIKVTITMSDLEERNIDLDALSYNSDKTQELFWDVIEQVEEEFGFDVSDSQFIIDTMSDEAEGFIITITRFDEDRDFESIQKYIKNKLSSRDLKVKRKSKKIYSTVSIYSFKCFDDLCSLSSKINTMYTGESSVYKYRETYYLVLTLNYVTASDVKMLETVLNEYGTKARNVDFLEGFLSEYGTCMIGSDAISVLSKYFS